MSKTSTSACSPFVSVTISSLTEAASPSLSNVSVDDDRAARHVHPGRTSRPDLEGARGVALEQRHPQVHVLLQRDAAIATVA